jgi:hypothetical protein
MEAFQTVHSEEIERVVWNVGAKVDAEELDSRGKSGND